MTRPPAFQFYAGDFLVGVRLLSLDERGAYITLLCHQWDKGSVPGDDLEALRKILGSTRAKTRSIWQALAEKFPRDKGVFRNLRLERERRKQRRFRQKQAQNGKKGGRPRNNPSLSFGLTQTKPKKSPSSSSSIFRSKNGARRAPMSFVTIAEVDHIKNSREVKRLMLEEGLTLAEASRRVGYH